MKNTEKGKYYYLIRLNTRIIKCPKMINPRLPLFKFDVIMLHFCNIPKYRQNLHKNSVTAIITATLKKLQSNKLF